MEEPKEYKLSCGGCGEGFEPHEFINHVTHLGGTEEMVARMREKSDAMRELMRRIQVDPEGTGELYLGPDPRKKKEEK